MKILILNSLYYPNIIGGAEKSVQLLAESLLSRGHEPVVITTSDGFSVDYINGVKVYYLKIPNLYTISVAKEQPLFKKPLWHMIDTVNPFITSILQKIIKKERPDLFHTHNLAGISVQAWKVAKSFQLPIVHTIRDHYLLCPNSEMYNRGKICENQCVKCWLFSIPKKSASALVNAVTGVSKSILRKHVSLNYFSKVVINTHIYNPVRMSLGQARRNCNEKNITFGYVGMLEKGKGIEFLLERFASMDIPSACLKIFGKGSSKKYEAYLRKRFDRSNIRFEGRKKPDEIYSSIDVAIVPSLRNEAFGRIVPEANSYGIPVIVSNRGALPEIVNHGQNGFVFNPDKSGDLESQIMNAIENQNTIKSMSPDCQKEAEKYSEEKIVDQYITLYENLVR